MAYDLAEKQKERHDARAIVVNGETFRPKRHTIGLARELDEIRERLADLFDEIEPHERTINGGHLDETTNEWVPLPEEPKPSAVKKAKAEAKRLGDEITTTRLELIVAALGPSDTDGVLTVDVLRDAMELADIEAYQQLLFTGRARLPEGPTGGSESA